MARVCNERLNRDIFLQNIYPVKSVALSQHWRPLKGLQCCHTIYEALFAIIQLLKCFGNPQILTCNHKWEEETYKKQPESNIYIKRFKWSSCPQTAPLRFPCLYWLLESQVKSSLSANRHCQNFFRLARQSIFYLCKHVFATHNFRFIANTIRGKQKDWDILNLSDKCFSIFFFIWCLFN